MEESEEEYTYSDGEDEDLDVASSGDEAAAKASTGKKPRRSSAGTAGEAAGAAMLNEGSDEVSILKEQDLKALMDKVVDEIAGVMNVPHDAATALLRFFSWNCERLYDRFYADPDSVTAKVGIGNAAEGTSAAAARKLTCRICTDEVAGSDALALPCAHYFCLDCWQGYLNNAVAGGPTCVYLTCPEHKCPQIVPEDVFRSQLSQEAFQKYQSYSLQSFVEINKKLRFCPGKGCSRVAQAPRSCPCVRCECGEVFCFKCGEEAHEPASCAELARWKEKCMNESETANWILANTKQCPKCDTRIEKNMGCNHMTCSRCKYEFCWICMGSWAEHGTTTGGFYKCNRFESKVKEGMDDVARAKAELERYLHYYKRYQGHAVGQKYALKQQEGDTEKRMVELLQAQDGSSGSGGGGWIDVQFLRAATEQLIDCRRALKYTYVFGYYMNDPSQQRQKQLFEHHQENLEKFTEKLSELSERPLAQMDRTEVINYTRVTGKFLRSLLQSVRDGLTDEADDGAKAA